MTPHPTTVLMLSATPKDRGRLRLDEERREIEAGLMERSRLRDNFRLITKVAVRPRDVQRAMLDHSPQIVHFGGHGEGGAGLVLEDETGTAKLVDADALASLFELFAEALSCVVLNACYSAVQAEAIAHHIPYVIGMSGSIGDRAAIEFAVAFYDALGSGRDVEFAYRNACVAIKMAGIPQADIPVLHRQTSLNPSPQTSLLTDPVMSQPHNLTEKQLTLLKEPMTAFKRQRLEQQQTDLQAEWNLQREKLKILREAFAIETGASVKFQVGKQIEATAAEVAKLEATLEEIEQALEATKK